MSEESYPKPVGEVVKILLELFRHSDQADVVELLEHSQARFEMVDYDNFNGGTSIWGLCLNIPTSLYVSFEEKLEQLKSLIGKRLEVFKEDYPNDLIGQVRITPDASDSPKFRTDATPADFEVNRLWGEGKFRLFLSHLAVHKVEVSALKKSLGVCGVDGFVAHEDITPTEEWRHEIEIGLKSMHALVALVTPKFQESPWTDQEVGWAMGRGVPVIPVRLGYDPYGFLGKYQAISGTLALEGKLASDIVKALVSKSRTSHLMRGALVRALLASTSYANSIRIAGFLESFSHFTDLEKGILERACNENHQVRAAFGVNSAVSKMIGGEIE